MSIVEETTIQLSKRCREKEKGRKTKGERESERERNEGKKKHSWQMNLKLHVPFKPFRWCQ